ncbi:MAG: EamA family transporter, partial [Bacteroidota bacterium]
ALYVTALNIIIGGAMMIPIAWALDGSPVGIVANTTQPLTWWAMAGLGVLCTGLTYSLWNWGQRQLPASIAGAFVNMEPLAGAILGITILGEAASPLLLAGGALILVGAFAASIVGGK